MTGESPLLSYSEARSSFRAVLNDADRGVPTGVHRAGSDVVMVDLGRYLQALLNGPLPRPVVVAEDVGWSVILPGVPVAADGVTLAAAVEDAVSALKEYAADWIDRLREAPNHAANWPLVHFAHFCSEQELRNWMTGDW